MHAMQYSFTLPADYDMGVIRSRVARLGHLLDGWEGLGIKAYLLRERGVHGSPVNQYGSFYLWNTMEGMNAFLWGGAFQGPVNDFGRPRIRRWTGLAYAEGGAADSPAQFAARRRRPVPDGVELAAFMAESADAAGELAKRDEVVLAAAAVDTCAWEVVHFSLWDREPPQAEGEVYQVLHLSAPERGALPRGRQW
ncbi:DUF4865 family protein [Streptomyces sp. NPDC093568]|uniref:DUF4865 family protein n=1 Tax=Streptomyces sp. NPDC093568 TaxID=3366041 RepID=UPI00382BEB49